MPSLQVIFTKQVTYKRERHQIVKKDEFYKPILPAVHSVQMST